MTELCLPLPHVNYFFTFLFHPAKLFDQVGKNDANPHGECEFVPKRQTLSASCHGGPNFCIGFNGKQTVFSKTRNGNVVVVGMKQKLNFVQI